MACVSSPRNVPRLARIRINIRELHGCRLNESHSFGKCRFLHGMAHEEKGSGSSHFIRFSKDKQIMWKVRRPCIEKP